MAKFIPFLGIFCGYIIVTFLTDTIEGRGILQNGNYDKHLKNENESGKIRLRRRDERSLSAHIKVSRCRKRGCRVAIEALLRRHRHRHGMPTISPKPTPKAHHTTSKKKSKHHDNKQPETSHEEDKTHVSERHKNQKLDEALNEEDRNRGHGKTEKNHHKTPKDHTEKHHKKTNKKKNKRKSYKKHHGKKKSHKDPEDVMQTGEGGQHYPDLDLDLSLDPEEIMQNGEGLPASRYDIASYDQYYAGYGRRRFGRLQRPPGADRLERRLNPNVATAAHHLLSSMDRVVLALKDRIQTMHDNYDYVFNGTRYTMMNGVREELRRIAQTNDKVYDVVLDISLLTKDIYMRAHRRGLTRPTTRQRDMPTFASLSEALNTTYHSQMESKKQRDEVQQMMDECQRQASYLQQIQDTLKENTNRRELIDLTRHVNMTVRRLRAEFDTAMVVRKMNRYMFVSGGSTQEDVQEATMFLEDARRALRQAALKSRGNFVAHQDWKRRKSGEDYALAPVSLTDTRSRPHHRRTRQADSTISAEEKKRLRPIINRAVDHAQQLRHLANRIVRVLGPVLSSANHVISGGNGHVSHRVQASLLADKLLTDIQNIRIALDRIRIVIYNDDDLKVRCEELAEGSAYDDESSPIDCDDFLETGSANGTDTDVITSIDPDEESDLYFDGEKVPETTTQSIAKRFGEKLNLHVIQLKKSGEQTLTRAKTASNRTNEMSHRWNRVTVNLGVGDRFVMESTEFISDWNREQPKFDQISEKVKEVNEKVDFIYNITQAKTLQALLKAEKKLREVKGQEGEGSTRSDDGGSGNSNQDFAAAIQATNKVKNTTSAILRFNRQIPSLVAGMDDRMNEIRDKISSLREKVNKARLVMASFQVSINKTDEGYIPLTLTSSDGSQSMQTSIELCIKPEVPEGHVLLVTGNQANSYSLSMSDKKLTMTVYDNDGDDVGYVTSNNEVEADKWYSVLVQRTGRNVSLSVRAEGEAEADVIGDIMDVDYTQSTPLSAYLGGAPESLPMSLKPGEWKGCVGGLRVNGWSVGLLQKSSEGIVPLPCSSHCSPAPTLSSMVFEGAGYLHYPVGTVQLRYPTRSVYFEFRTRQENAFLISVVKRGFHLRVQLEDGTLLVETTTPSEAVVLRSENSKYNDGVFHTLKIAYRDSTTYPEIDGKDGLFSIEDPTPVHTQSPVQGIVIGGMMEEHQHTIGSKFRPLIGCMRKLQINDVTMTMAEVAEAEGVHVGSCSNSNMWLGCVEFGNTSTAIDYGTTEEAKTVIIAVTRGSIGPVLQYHKGDKFNAMVSMKENEIDIYEYVADYNGQLALKEDDNNSFVVIKITDASSTVTFEYMDKQASFSYESGGGWFSTEETVPYTIIVGGQEEETDMPPFQGGISQLLVGNRYVDMSKYIGDNKLSACSRRFDPSSRTSGTTPLASRRR